MGGDGGWGWVVGKEGWGQVWGIKITQGCDKKKKLSLENENLEKKSLLLISVVMDQCGSKG